MFDLALSAKLNLKSHFLFKTYLLSTFCGPGTGLGAADV